MECLSKFLIKGMPILMVWLLSAPGAYANPVSIPGPETEFLIGLAFVVGAVIFSARAIKKIKQRRNKGQE
jgi:hypothetical protein